MRLARHVGVEGKTEKSPKAMYALGVIYGSSIPNTTEPHGVSGCYAACRVSSLGDGLSPARKNRSCAASCVMEISAEPHSCVSTLAGSRFLATAMASSTEISFGARGTQVRNGKYAAACVRASLALAPLRQSLGFSFPLDCNALSFALH